MNTCYFNLIFQVMVFCKLLIIRTGSEIVCIKLTLFGG